MTTDELLEKFAALPGSDCGLWYDSKDGWCIMDWFQWDMHQASAYHPTAAEALTEYLFHRKVL